LIIFDLDDTLIDTSGFITPFKMKECFQKLRETGLPLSTSAYNELLEKNQAASKSKIAVVEFAKKYNASDDQIQKVLDVLQDPLPESFQIPMTPYAKEILDYYRNRYTIALVTSGHPVYQMDKLKKAGIDSSIFSMIAIPEDSVKKPYYEALQKKNHLQAKEVWVCGDRVEMDLKPAHELGFNTIHMRWGRGAYLESEKWVDYSINTLHALKEIIR
jgi:putative hydrolase of the HAD superfamily